jgi:hypothetical protein
MKLIAICTAIAITAGSAAAYADDATKPIAGAVVGAVVGGPVGAVVGAIVGSSLTQHPSVTYERRVVVGEPLPESYTYYEVPDHQEYEYIIINGQRVIVERGSHRVVRVVE